MNLPEEEMHGERVSHRRLEQFAKKRVPDHRVKKADATSGGVLLHIDQSSGLVFQSFEDLVLSGVDCAKRHVQHGGHHVG